MERQARWGVAAMLGPLVALAATWAALACVEETRRVGAGWLAISLAAAAVHRIPGIVILMRRRLVARRARRAAFMLCDNCLYPIATPDCRTCPECGADLALLRQRWHARV